MVAVVLACSLPAPQVLPEPTWTADCDGWECPGATGVEWSDLWVVCEWECTSWEGQDGVDLAVSLRIDAGCWETSSVAVEQRDCTWASY